jgi:hypothetical protein
MPTKINKDVAALFRSDRRALENSLRDAAQAVKVAERAWGLWADSVRMVVEKRYEESTDDTAILDDPIYGPALDFGGKLRDLTKQLSEIRSGYERLAKELPRD